MRPCHVVDVLYHPWVIARCQKDPRFRAGVLDLAVHWVAQERGIVLNKVRQAGRQADRSLLSVRFVAVLHFVVAFWGCVT